MYPETELEEARWFELAEIDHALTYGANATWDVPMKDHGDLHFNHSSYGAPGPAGGTGFVP